MSSQSLLWQYAPSEARYDEMVDDIHIPRPHWRGFLSHLANLPAPSMAERAQFVRDTIASDGVTYNVYADPKGTSRPWELDLFPFILPAHEWQAIASAVAQRARLLNAVLCDLYGPQTLLAEGLVPPALVFGQRSYLWPVHGIPPAHGIAMHLYAADLARSPDGRWWIMADRTRGPSGTGYVLQNRITLSRAFPDAFRELQVEQLAPYFNELRDSLHRLSKTRGETPLVVLLTPGPFNETYFEHSFLARYLGFPLVEGQDLIVRGDRVFLKTLRGLRRVHAILRRLDDDFCDPVELRADSALGIPGLLHAIRTGNVVMANALGSAVLESSAFSGFYPAISQRLFGEPLQMPSIATWWCGEAPALDYVVKNLHDLVVKPAYPTMAMEPVFGHQLDAKARDALLERMHAQPHAYVAQEWVRLSHTPTWGEQEHLVPRSTTVRVFAVATQNGYVVLPGGLTRVAQGDGDVVSMQWGGASKDTWMLADTPVNRIPLRRPRLLVADMKASAVDIASRVGENLYWMGRYAERCEAVARLLRAALVRVADANPEERPALRTLASACERLSVLESERESGKSLDLEDMPKSIAFANDDHRFVAAVVDPTITGGLAANVQRLTGCANHVRERMSTDNWRVFNRLSRRMPPPDAPLGAALETVDEIMMGCVSLAGFAMDDMTRDESWQFLLLGRRLERLTHLVGCIEHVLRLHAADREEALEWLLEAANSIVTFRARYRRAPELLPVLQLVVFDETNPHAVAFQLKELSLMLVKIALELGGENPDLDFIDVLDPLSDGLRKTELERFEPESGPELEAACADLAALLERTERAGHALSDELQRRFFSHAGSPAPLGITTEIAAIR